LRTFGARREKRRRMNRGAIESEEDVVMNGGEQRERWNHSHILA